MNCYEVPLTSPQVKTCGYQSEVRLRGLKYTVPHYSGNRCIVTTRELKSCFSSPISSNHISKTHPELVKKYGEYLWLDPGEKAVQDYIIKIIEDVIKRYDIDAVHIDDYFYPYTEENSQGQIIDFPDEPSWQKYLNFGGKLNRSDWRRENINTLIQGIYRTIKSKKSWVKFGISPFGVWKPHHPSQISNTQDNGASFSAYDQIYADSRKWLQLGWLDYLSPQLYWRIEQTAQSYPVILHWWLEQNTQYRNIFPGLFTSRVANLSRQNWSAQEILYQIRITRGFVGTGGNIHFSMKSLMQNNGGIADLLDKEVYTQPALIPAYSWLNNQFPAQPELTICKDFQGNIQLNWKTPDPQKIQLWVLQTKTGLDWKTNILPAQQNSYLLKNQQVEIVAVSAVTRYGIQGKSIIEEVKESSCATQNYFPIK